MTLIPPPFLSTLASFFIPLCFIKSCIDFVRFSKGRSHPNNFNFIYWFSSYFLNVCTVHNPIDVKTSLILTHFTKVTTRGRGSCNYVPTTDHPAEAVIVTEKTNILLRYLHQVQSLISGLFLVTFPVQNK